ncbi:MAG: hypothetical protein FWC27_15705 [Firmicutes bacterium]|nr:hypothetical protein [Bacillota bacterium]
MKEKYLAFIRGRRFLGVLLAAAFAFVTGFALMRNPLLEENTASLLGLRYPKMFFLWQLLVGLAYMYGTLALYHAFDCPQPLRGVGKALAWLGVPCQAVIYFVHGEIAGGTVTYPGATKPIHWTATILLMAGILLSVGIAFFHARKQVRRFGVLLAALSAVLAGMLLVFFTIGKSGLFEAVPLWVLFILLFLANCTKPFAPPELQSQGF